MIDIEELKNSADSLGMWDYYLGKKSHNGRYKCPFNATERQYNISVKNNTWHCFSCGDGGDIIKLVQKMYQLSFKNAVKKICQDFNLGDNEGLTAVDIKHIEERRLQREILKLKREKFEEKKKAVFQNLIRLEHSLTELIDDKSLNGRNYITYSYSDDINEVFDLIKIYNRVSALLDFVVCKSIVKNSDNAFIFELLGSEGFETKESYNSAVDKLFRLILKGDLDIYGEED